MNYRAISVNLPCDYTENNDSKLFIDRKVYKIFAQSSLDEDTVNRIFVKDQKLLERVSWLAFPDYEKFQKKPFPGIYIDSQTRSQVLYLNAFEWASSCMEIACISARNAAIIVSYKERGRIESGKIGN